MRAYTYTTVRLPESDLGDVVLDFAAPLLDALGAEPPIEAARDALAIAIELWNASVLASKRWTRRKTKPLSELRTRMRASPERAKTFALLTERWKRFWLDPRLVQSWTYDVEPTGAQRLSCVVGLPENVFAEVPPPIEKRISIGGKWLDEVRVRLSDTSLLSFPIERHRGTVDGGVATVRSQLPCVLQLFAEGVLQRVGGPPVEVVIGGRQLGPMMLARVSCAGTHYDEAVLVFRSVTSEGPGT